MNHFPPILFGVWVLLNGQYQFFSEADALLRVHEQPFAQALGHALPATPKTYLEITQMRQGNTTTDAVLELKELGR